MSAMDGLRRSIVGRLQACNLDELRVLDQLLVRLEAGRDRYGHLDLSRRRDWARERAEEAADYAVYDACLLLAQRDEAMRAPAGLLSEAALREAALREMRDATPEQPSRAAKLYAAAELFQDEPEKFRAALELFDTSDEDATEKAARDYTRRHADDVGSVFPLNGGDE